jgi:hypothetical protein
MESESKVQVDLRYFNLDMGKDIDPQNSQTQEKMVYAQLEANMGRT